MIRYLYYTTKSAVCKEFSRRLNKKVSLLLEVFNVHISQFARFFLFILTFVFQLGRIASAKVPLGFVLHKHPLDLAVKSLIRTLKAVCNVLVDGRFAYSEDLCSGSDGRLMLDKVFGKELWAVIVIIYHGVHSRKVLGFVNIYFQPLRYIPDRRGNRTKISDFFVHTSDFSNRSKKSKKAVDDTAFSKNIALKVLQRFRKSI